MKWMLRCMMLAMMVGYASVVVVVVYFGARLCNG